MKQQRDPAQPSGPAQPDIFWRPLWILEILQTMINFEHLIQF